METTKRNRITEWLFPPSVAAFFGLANIVLAFIQNNGDARWYRVCFGLVFVAGAFQMHTIETLAAALREARKEAS